MLFGGFGGQQVIITNANCKATIIENDGIFGKKQQVIRINRNGGYGGTTNVIQTARLRVRQEIMMSCPSNCTNSCCFPSNRVICQPGCMNSCCYRATNLCPLGCQKPCCSNLDIILVCPPGCQKICCKMVTCQRLFELRNGVWTGPRPHSLTLKRFDLHLFPSIHKLKVKTTIQPYSSQLYNKQIIMKAHIGYQTHFFAAQYTIIETYYLNIVYLKLNSVFPESTERFKGDFSGIILKKSQLLGNWEQRYVRITRTDGLRSHKSINSASSLHISSIRQLWTRFEILKGKYFVIKLIYIGVKFEFAVPVNQCLPWTQAFFSMLERR